MFNIFFIYFATLESPCIQNGFYLHYYILLKQQKNFYQIATLWQWTLLPFTCMIAAYIFVSNIDNFVAIYAAIVLVPCLCFKIGEDCKHQYSVCLFLIIIGIQLVAQPGFIFGYSSDQLIGCILAFYH